MNPYRVPGGEPTEESRKPIRQTIKESEKPIVFEELESIKSLKSLLDLYDILDYEIGLKR